MKMMLLVVMMGLSLYGLNAAEKVPVKEAEYKWNGKFQAVTFFRLENNQPVEYVQYVKWIAKVETTSQGDGVTEQVYIYQTVDGEVKTTPWERWHKNKVGRFGNILKIEGHVRDNPPIKEIEFWCFCNGKIEKRRRIRVFMDGKEHYHGNDL